MFVIARRDDGLLLFYCSRREIPQGCKVNPRVVFVGSINDKKIIYEMVKH